MSKKSLLLGLITFWFASPILIIAFIFLILPLFIITGSLKLAIFIYVGLIAIILIGYIYKSEIKLCFISLCQRGIINFFSFILIPLIAIVLIICIIGQNKMDYYGLHGQLHIVKEINSYKGFNLFKDPYTESKMEVSHYFVYIYDSDWNLLRRIQYDRNNKKVASIEFSFNGDEPQLTTTKYVDNVPFRYSPLSYRRNPIENDIFVFDKSHISSAGTIENQSYQTYNEVPFRVMTISNNSDGSPDKITISDAKSIYAGIARVDEEIYYKYSGESFSISYYDNHLMQNRFELIEKTNIEISHVTVK